MTDARASVLMETLETAREVLVRTSARFAELVRWSLATVDDEPPRDVIPLPGPAHGPVPAINVRIEERRRRRAS